MIDFAKVPDIDPDIHPIGNYRKITKWMVDFCEGDFTEAIILSFFLAMYHSQRKYFLEAVRKNQIFKQYGLTKKESESIELIFSYREISDHIFNVTKKYEVLKARLDSLASRGVITIKKALTVKDKHALGLDTRLSTDRTNVYLFHPTPLITYLQPYLNLQTDHDNDIQNSINLLEGKGLLQKTDKGYFIPYQNKKTSGATAHLKKFQAKEVESKTTETKSYTQIIEEFKKFTKQLSYGSQEEFAKLKFKKDGEFIKIIYSKETLSGYQKETIQTFFKNNNTNIYFEDNDN